MGNIARLIWGREKKKFQEKADKSMTEEKERDEFRRQPMVYANIIM